MSSFLLCPVCQSAPEVDSCGRCDGLGYLERRTQPAEVRGARTVSRDEARERLARLNSRPGSSARVNVERARFPGRCTTCRRPIKLGDDQTRRKLVGRPGWDRRHAACDPHAAQLAG